MARKTKDTDYASVFDGRSRRERLQDSATAGLSGTRRGAQPAAPSFAGTDELTEFVEQQVRAITAVVRLAASGREPLKVDVEPAKCLMCENTDEAHLHGAKLFVAGKEAF